MDAFDFLISGRSHFSLSKRSLSFNNVMFIQTRVDQVLSLLNSQMDLDIAYPLVSVTRVGFLFKFAAVIQFHISYTFKKGRDHSQN